MHARHIYQKEKKERESVCVCDHFCEVVVVVVTLNARVTCPSRMARFQK